MTPAKASRPTTTGKRRGLHGPDDDEAEQGGAVSADKYPNLAAQQEMDRQEHVRRAREMGATRKQASQHAAEEVGHH